MFKLYPAVKRVDIDFTAGYNLNILSGISEIDVNNIIGRVEEQRILERIYKSPDAEFVAVYGRRRIGKTFLIDQFFSRKKNLFFRITGLKDGSVREQIYNFTRSIEQVFFESKLRIKEPGNWNQALELLTNAINQQTSSNPIVIFFDELPWIASKKSSFLKNLDYYWNHYWSKFKNVKLIVSGSAASWMINNLIRNKGGLHNRITAKIILYPFNLAEVKQFLESRKFKYSNHQILDLYMTFGGVPYYLKLLDRTYSHTANIDNLCFSRKGALTNEFNELYSSLFTDHAAYEEIIRIIASKRRGVARTEILRQAKLSVDGGSFNERLQALEEAGFIIGFKPYGKKTRGKYFRIIDEYSLFYLSWIEPNLTTIQKIAQLKGYWQKQSLLPIWNSWAGYAFESICYKHLQQIRVALNIEVNAETGNWQFIPKKGARENGAQIDLLFDRKDKTITICEIKYCENPYALNKNDAQNLLNKIEVFKKITQTKKQITLALITAGGIKETMYSEELINNAATLDDLFIS